MAAHFWSRLLIPGIAIALGASTLFAILPGPVVAPVPVTHFARPTLALPASVPDLFGRLTVSTPIASPTDVDVQREVSVFTTVSGGVAPYVYTWSGLPSGCGPENTSSFTCAPNATGWYNVSVGVTDRELNSAISGTAPVDVVSLPIAGILVSSTGGSVPTPEDFTLNITGGVPPFAAIWAFGDNSVGEGLTTSHTYASGGNFTVRVAVTDSEGALAQATTTVSVRSLPPNTANSHSRPQGAPLWTYVAGGAVATALAVLLVVLVRRRRVKLQPVMPPLPQDAPQVSGHPYVPPPNG